MKDDTSKWLTISSTSTILSFIIQTLTTIALARIFSPEEFGAIAAVAIITSYADIFWQMGLGPSIVQKKKIDKSDVNTAHCTSIVLGIITVIILNVFSQQISFIVGLKNPLVLSFMSFSFIINSFGVIPNSLLQRNLEFKKIAIKDVLGNLVYFIVALFLGINHLGVWSLVIATNLRYLVLSLLPYYFVRSSLIYDFKLFSISRIKEMMSFGIGYSISRILNVTTSQIDYIIVSKSIGEVALGFYSRAFQLMTVPANLMGQIVDLVYFPVMSKIQENDKELNQIFINYSSLMSLLYFPVSSLLFVYSDEFVFIFLGKNWMDVSMPLKILGLSLFFRVGYKITDPLFRAKGAVYERALIHLSQAIFTSLFAYIGVKIGGLVGVSIGVSFSLLLNYIIISFRVSKLVGISIKELNISIFIGMLLNYISIPLLIFIKNNLFSVFPFVIAFIFSVILSLILIFLINYLCYLKVYDENSMNVIRKRIRSKKASY